MSYLSVLREVLRVHLQNHHPHLLAQFVGLERRSRRDGPAVQDGLTNVFDQLVQGVLGGLELRVRICSCPVDANQLTLLEQRVGNRLEPLFVTLQKKGGDLDMFDLNVEKTG